MGSILLAFILVAWLPARQVMPPCTALPDPRQPGQCYPPAEVKQAQAGFGTGVIPARRVVERVTHLRLAQVEVLETEVPNPGVPQNYAIFYFFGAIPHDAQGQPVATGRSPRYVLVAEYAQRGGIPGKQISRDIGPLQTFHVTAGSGSVPWTLRTDVPGRNLTLSVTSNTALHTVMAIAARLLLRARPHT